MDNLTKYRPAGAVREHSTRYLTLIFLALMVLGLTASCARKDKPTVTKITYAMPITVAAIPAYVALEKGFWKEEALNVEAQMFSAGRGWRSMLFLPRAPKSCQFRKLL